MATVFDARFRSTCEECQDVINAGDEVVYEEGRVIHVECATGWIEY